MKIKITLLVIFIGCLYAKVEIGGLLGAANGSKYLKGGGVYGAFVNYKFNQNNGIGLGINRFPGEISLEYNQLDITDKIELLITEYDIYYQHYFSPDVLFFMPIKLSLKIGLSTLYCSATFSESELKDYFLDMGYSGLENEAKLIVENSPFFAIGSTIMSQDNWSLDLEFKNIFLSYDLKTILKDYDVELLKSESKDNYESFYYFTMNLKYSFYSRELIQEENIDQDKIISEFPGQILEEVTANNRNIFEEEHKIETNLNKVVFPDFGEKEIIVEPSQTTVNAGNILKVRVFTKEPILKGSLLVNKLPKISLNKTFVNVYEAEVLIPENYMLGQAKMKVFVLKQNNVLLEDSIFLNIR